MKIIEIPLDKIRPPKRPIRSQMDEEKLHSLKKSLKEVGPLQNIIVKRVGDEYEIVSGHRRYEAAKMAQLASLPAVVVESGQINEYAIIWHENFERDEINPVDEGDYFDYILRSNNLSLRQLGEILHVSHAYIAERLKLVDACEEIRSALKMGQISFAQAREFLKFKSKSQMLYYLKWAINNGATVR